MGIVTVALPRKEGEEDASGRVVAGDGFPEALKTT